MMGARKVATLAVTWLLVTFVPLRAQVPESGAELTPAEQRLARTLAAQAVRAFTTRGPIYLVAVERLRDKAAEERDTTARSAIVTHYRYDGDLAIRTIIDLSRQAVVRSDTAPHAPVPLAPEEFEQARRLALTNGDVRAALGPDADSVVIEALVLRTASVRDPIYGRRVVRLLFRLGPDYLREPVVLVDLTNGRVTIERPER